MSHRVIADYQALIVNLISSNTLHLRPCLKMIVSKFVPGEPLFEKMRRALVLIANDCNTPSLRKCACTRCSICFQF